MKDLLRLFGTRGRGLCVVAIAALVGFSLAACGGSSPSDDPDDDDGDVITFGLEKVSGSETSFQITIDGASWHPSLSAGYLVKLDGIEFFTSEGGQSVINADTGKYANGNDGSYNYFQSGGSPNDRTKVMELTSRFVGMNGTLSLSLDNPDNDPKWAVGTRPNLDQYTCEIDPDNASITFDYTPPPPSIAGTWESAVPVMEDPNLYMKIEAGNGGATTYAGDPDNGLPWVEVIRSTYPVGAEDPVPFTMNQVNERLFNYPGPDSWKTWEGLDASYKEYMGNQQTLDVTMENGQFTMYGKTFEKQGATPEPVSFPSGLIGTYKSTTPDNVQGGKYVWLKIEPTQYSYVLTDNSGDTPNWGQAVTRTVLRKEPLQLSRTVYHATYDTSLETYINIQLLLSGPPAMGIYENDVMVSNIWCSFSKQ